MNKISRPSKYQQIFTTAKDLFWRYGIKKITIEEICLKANVSKMTFYKYFPNKIELAKVILTDTIEESIRETEQVLKSDKLFEEKVKEMFTIKLHSIDNITIEFINDIYQNPKFDLGGIIESNTKKSTQMLLDFISESQKSGHIRKDIKPDFIIHYLGLATQMIKDDVLNSKYNKPSDLVLETMNFLFYGLLP